jgi:hypothetical protein
MDKEAEWCERYEKLVNRVNEAFPRPDFENWSLCEELILSTESACEKIIRFKIETENARVLLTLTATYLIKIILLVYQQSLVISNKVRG